MLQFSGEIIQDVTTYNLALFLHNSFVTKLSADKNKAQQPLLLFKASFFSQKLWCPF